MPPKIDKVNWSASNLPSGISLNAETGIFTGTPKTVGTYKVPVKVETNYGEDQKDVKICVWPKGDKIYVVGPNDYVWGGGKNVAVRNEYGLIELNNMPRAYEIQFHLDCDHNYTSGFTALCEGGRYYACGDNIPVLNDKGNVVHQTFLTPTELTDSYGFRNSFGIISFRIGSSNTDIIKSSYGDIFWNKAGNAVSVYSQNGIETIPVSQVAQKYKNTYNYSKRLFGYLFLDADGQTWHQNGETFTYPLKNGVKKYVHTSKLQDPYFHEKYPDNDTFINACYYRLYIPQTKTFQKADTILVLDNNGDLYELGSNEILASGVRDFWAGFATYNTSCHCYVYIQKNDGSLWIRGRVCGAISVISDARDACLGHYNTLGMGDIINTGEEFIKLGDYDEIKKIVLSFSNGGVMLMLTESGKLYHTGSAFPVVSNTQPYSTPVQQHESMTFQRMLPDLKIKDIATNWGCNTWEKLVLIIDDD